MSEAQEWPVPPTRLLPPDFVERAKQAQAGLGAVLAAMRALPASDLVGVEPAHATRWITDSPGDDR